MTLPLHRETLQHAYDYLRSTPPFSRWNLPEGEDVAFKVVRSSAVQGRYYLDNGKHIIEVSSRLIGRTQSLMELMAHEMVHLHQKSSGMAKGGEHNAAFRKLAEAVCKVHGFDPKLF